MAEKSAENADVNLVPRAFPLKKNGKSPGDEVVQTWKDDEFLLGFRFSRVKIYIYISGGVKHEKFMGDFTYRDSGSRQVQLFFNSGAPRARFARAWAEPHSLENLPIPENLVIT